MQYLAYVANFIHIGTDLYSSLLVPDLSSQTPGFTCRPVCMRFVVDRVTLGQVFL